MNILFFLRPKSGVTYLTLGNSLRQGLERMRGGYTEVPVVDKEGNYKVKLTINSDNTAVLELVAQ